MTLHGFLGDRAEKNQDLPSAPMARASEGQGDSRMPRGGNPWQRKVREELPPSKSEQSNNWRSVGGGGGGRGGDRFGSRGGDRFGDRGGSRNPWESGGGGIREDRNRFDTRDNGRWGGRTQDPRFSGGRTQDPRFSGGRDVDTRPAHLRRFKKPTNSGPSSGPRNSSQSSKQETKKTTERRLTPEERAARERSKQWDDQKLKGSKAVKLKHTDEERLAREKEIDAKLEQQEIKYTNPQSPLELAVDPEHKEDTDITFGELTESFRRLDLKKTKPKASALALSSSLLLEKFTLAEMCSSIKANVKNSEDASAVVVATLVEIFSKGRRTFLKILGKLELATINDLVNTGQSSEEYDAFLQTQNLLFLKTVPDVSEEVSQTLQQGASSTETMALLDSKMDSAQTPTNLIPVISTSVLNLVFAGKDPALDVIVDWAKVLLRCLSDVASEISILFTAQRVWYKKTKARPMTVNKKLRAVFQKLHECELVSFEALAGWRDDRKTKVKGKPQALLGVSTWITEITPPEPEPEEGDEEEDEEEPIDEYLRNPNSEFF